MSQPFATPWLRRALRGAYGGCGLTRRLPRVWEVGNHPPVWHGTSVSDEFSDAPAGTRLFVRQGSFTTDEGRAIPAFIWGRLMPRLKAYAESGRPQPFFRSNGSG